MDNSTPTALANEELNEANLIGAVVFGADDVRIGTVSHVHGLYTVLEVIIDVGGFLGIGARPVALAASEMNFTRTDAGAVYAQTTWTKAEVSSLPEHHNHVRTNNSSTPFE
jgi:hypothetical protein